MARDPRFRVYSAESLTQVAHVRNLLESENIECEITNENLGSVMGEIPFAAVWPGLWVLHEADIAEAKRLIDTLVLGDPPTGPGWQCKGCRTEIEGQFAVCWQCGRAQDD